MSETVLGAEGLDELLVRARQALDSAREIRTRAGAIPIQATAASRDQRIRATVAAPGRITALHIHPDVLERDTAAVTAALTAVVNAALEDLRKKAPQAAGGPDLDALHDQLAELHEDSVRQMARFTSAANDTIAQIRARRTS